MPTKRHSAKSRHSAKIGFAECLITDTRQTQLCRVPRGQHSAHSLTCAPHTPAAPVTRHGRYCLPSARKGTLGKHLFAECHEAGTRQRLSRAPHTTVTPLPPCCHEHYTVAKTVTVIVCRVPGWGTRQRFVNAECNYCGTRHSNSLPSVLFSSRRNNKKNSPT